MLSKGNGSPQVCVLNLIRMTRGECPFSRVKGIDPRHFSRPALVEKEPLMADIEWLIETFEPRANTKNIDLADLAAQAGDFAVNTTVEVKGGTT